MSPTKWAHKRGQSNQTLPKITSDTHSPVLFNHCLFFFFLFFCCSFCLVFGQVLVFGETLFVEKTCYIYKQLMCTSQEKKDNETETSDWLAKTKASGVTLFPSGCRYISHPTCPDTEFRQALTSSPAHRKLYDLLPLMQSIAHEENV